MLPGEVLCRLLHELPGGQRGPSAPAGPEKGRIAIAPDQGHRPPVPGPREGHGAEFGVKPPVPPPGPCPVSQEGGGPTPPLPGDQGQQHRPLPTLTGPGEDPAGQLRGPQAPPAPSPAVGRCPRRYLAPRASAAVGLKRSCRRWSCRTYRPTPLCSTAVRNRLGDPRPVMAPRSPGAGSRGRGGTGSDAPGAGPAMAVSVRTHVGAAP